MPVEVSVLGTGVLSCGCWADSHNSDRHTHSCRRAGHTHHTGLRAHTHTRAYSHRPPPRHTPMHTAHTRTHSLREGSATSALTLRTSFLVLQFVWPAPQLEQQLEQQLAELGCRLS